MTSTRVELKLPICCPNCGHRLGSMNGSVRLAVPEKKFEVKSLNLSLSDIKWPQHATRIRKVFENDNLRTVGDLVSRTEAELLRNPNFGQICLETVKAKLVELNLHLGMFDQERA